MSKICLENRILQHWSPQIKFEAIIFKDEGGDRFRVKTHESQEILDLGRCNFLPVPPIVMILVFLKSRCRESFPKMYTFIPF